MNIQIIWDLEDEPDGNYWHIVVEGHGVTQGEVEEVLLQNWQNATTSHSSGNPITFGWTSSGKHIAVLFEKVATDPPAFYPLTAFVAPVPRKRKKK